MNGKLKKIDFTNKEIYLGMDVHSKTWYTTILYDDFVKKQSFHADARKLAAYMRRNYPKARIQAGYEAGYFGFTLQRNLESEGIETIVINPADIPLSNKDTRNKTDRRDSYKIALNMKSKMVEGIYVPKIENEQERSLLRRRADTVKKQTRIKNQIKSNLKLLGINYPIEYEDKGKHWSRNFISWIGSLKLATQEGRAVMESLLRELEFYRKEVLFATRQIRDLSKSERYAYNCKLLLGISGIGLITAMTFLTEIIDISRFKKGDELVSFLGFSPNEHSSGEKRRIGHLSKRCNHILRGMLIESSWVAIRNDPALSDYYHKTQKKTGSSKAIIKTARKLIMRMRYVLKTGNKYVTQVIK